MVASPVAEIRQIDNLLVAKLETPFRGMRIVTRDRLMALLNEAVHQQVTLVTAPTGYGKTTLLAEWVTTQRAPAWHIVWVSLDEFDNAPLRLWSYVVAGLKKIHPRLKYDLLQTVRRSSDPHDPTLLNPLVNEMAQMPGQLFIVLDDYQTIREANVHRSLAYVIEHQPANLHLVLASRATPPLPLSRLRAQRHLLEVTAQDLSFTLPEVRSYLSKVMELELDAEQTASLFNATEGWIAGLQLAALSRQGRRMGSRPASADALRDNRPILDYLTLEVLNEQSETVKEFLLKTSILAELNAALCDEMLGRSDSRDLLAQVEQANLFMTALDGQQTWFRYHPLFAEALQIQLQRTYPGQVAGLHTRACTWLVDHGYPEKAVSHALAADDIERAAKTVDACAIRAIIEYNITSLLQWIGYFDKGFFARQPRLGIYYALATLMEERFEAAEQILRNVEDVLERAAEIGISAQEVQVLRWEASAIRAVMECLGQNYDQGIAHANELLAHRPQDDDYYDGFVHFALAEAYDAAGQLEAAAAAFDRGCQFAVPHRHRIEYVHARCEVARMRKKQGRLNDAKAAHLDAIDFASRTEQGPIILALPQSGLLEIAVEQYDLPAARALALRLAEAFDQIKSERSLRNYVGWISARLAMYYLAAGDAAQAQAYYQKALVFQQHNQRGVWPFRSEMAGLGAKVSQALANHPAGEAVDAADSLPVDASSDGQSNADMRAALVRLALARLALGRGDNAGALADLEMIEGTFQAAGFGDRLIEVRVLQALALRAVGQTGPALSCLNRAIGQAEPEGYAWVFVSEGEPMHALLLEYLAALSPDTPAPHRRYAVRLASLFGANLASEAQPPVEYQPPAAQLRPLVESLSARELEVLKLLVSGKSVKEIAATLLISANTAKVHVRHIYRKLGSHSRKVAFESAAELGLLDRLPEH